MRPEGRLTSILCGVAREYFVAAELSRRGYVASLTLRNTRGIDVLASSTDGIQVKTNQNDKREWILNKKAESENAENLFYVFVRLGSTGPPAFHVVPRATVANIVTTGHREWLSAPGKRGRMRADSSVREFRDPDDKYLGRWDLLGFDPLPNQRLQRPALSRRR